MGVDHAVKKHVLERRDVHTQHDLNVLVFRVSDRHGHAQRVGALHLNVDARHNLAGDEPRLNQDSCWERIVHMRVVSVVPGFDKRQSIHQFSVQQLGQRVG